jgi:hypothetical protein
MPALAGTGRQLLAAGLPLPRLPASRPSVASSDSATTLGHPTSLRPSLHIPMQTFVACDSPSRTVVRFL